jgi:pimeloyl-ACP methyl ester carboxylesterase
VPARFTKTFPRGMSVRPGQIRAESQDGVAMIPVALAMRNRYQELSMPIVIMAGTKDRVVKDSQAIQLHEEIQHSVLRLIPGVGHMVHYAVPDEVARAIEEVGKPATMAHRTGRTPASYTASAA